MTVAETLNQLEQMLDGTESIPRAERNWGGADVCIVRHAPPKTKDGFYPDPRYAETKYPRELSWMFEQLRDAFYAEELIDGCSKIEFFGRLANAAIRAGKANPEISCAEHCRAVLDEAKKMYAEIKSDSFEYLTIAFGGEIADDRKQNK